MVKNTVAFSENEDKFKALEEVVERINRDGEPMLVIYFAPANLFEFYSKSLHKAYEKAIVIGASTYVSFSSQGAGKHALSAIAIYEGIECAADVLQDISHYPLQYISRIDEACEKLSGVDNALCLEYCTASGNCEELVQDTFKAALEHRHMDTIGGSAGAPTANDTAYVSLNGEVYEEAAVFVIIRNLGGRILTYKENMYTPTEHVLTATDVDCDERIVYEYNNESAAGLVASTLGMDYEVFKNEVFAFHPMGRLRGDEVYITAPKEIMPDGSVSYFARIYNYTKLAIMEPLEIEKVWKETSANIHYEIENPSFTIAVNCIIRSMYFENNNKFGNFCQFLKDEFGSYVGMSGFGEQYNYEHVNMTMVLLMFE